MELATNSFSFSFNGTKYHQVDCISMGSSLVPILSNIFVGFDERFLFDKFPKPYIYLRYVDDTFVCFSSHNKALFFYWLNDLHPSITFTMEEEKDHKLPFLDVLVEHCPLSWLVYIESLCSLVCWDAFAPKSRKVNLIKYLIVRT